MNQCINFEVCDTAAGRCVCPPTATGSNCDTAGPPIIFDITPDSGSVDGGTRINMNGNYWRDSLVFVISCFYLGFFYLGANFSRSLDRCFLNGAQISTTIFDSTNLTCVIPPGGAGTVPINVQRTTSEISNPFFFTYFPRISLTQIDPTFGLARQNTTVSVFGAGFADPVYCRFDEDIVLATVISPNELICFTPRHEPAQFQLELTRNLVDFVTGNAQTIFSFIENVSPVCRDQQNPEGGHPNRTFNTNLARAAGVTVSNTPLVASGNLSELIDSDFCCSLTQENNAIDCGIEFYSLFHKLSAKYVYPGIQFPENQQGVITLTLPRMAFINEATISFFDPCRTVPGMYSLDIGSTPIVTNRSTDGGGTSCPSFSSDAGSITLCTDFVLPLDRFPLLQANQLIWRFSDPIGPGGVVVYEVAAFGAYIDQPTTISIRTSSQWLNQRLPVASDETFLDFQLQLQTLDGMNAVILTPQVITVSLLDSTGVDRSNLLTQRTEMFSDSLQSIYVSLCL